MGGDGSVGKMPTMSAGGSELGSPAPSERWGWELVSATLVLGVAQQTDWKHKAEESQSSRPLCQRLGSARIHPSPHTKYINCR